jgi:hypothetical protein
MAAPRIRAATLRPHAPAEDLKLLRNDTGIACVDEPLEALGLGEDAIVGDVVSRVADIVLAAATLIALNPGLVPGLEMALERRHKRLLSDQRTRSFERRIRSTVGLIHTLTRPNAKPKEEDSTLPMEEQVVFLELGMRVQNVLNHFLTKELDRNNRFTSIYELHGLLDRDGRLDLELINVSNFGPKTKGQMRTGLAAAKIIVSEDDTTWHPEYLAELD